MKQQEFSMKTSIQVEKKKKKEKKCKNWTFRIVGVETTAKKAIAPPPSLRSAAGKDQRLTESVTALTNTQLNNKKRKKQDQKHGKKEEEEER